MGLGFSGENAAENLVLLNHFRQGVLLNIHRGDELFEVLAKQSHALVDKPLPVEGFQQLCIQPGCNLSNVELVRDIDGLRDRFFSNS